MPAKYQAWAAWVGGRSTDGLQLSSQQHVKSLEGWSIVYDDANMAHGTDMTSGSGRSNATTSMCSCDLMLPSQQGIATLNVKNSVAS